MSTFFFGCNYVGIIYGAITIPNDTNEQRKKMFLTTAFKHALFMSNNYLIHMLKLSFSQSRKLNAINDLGAFLCCFPSYLMIMLPKPSLYVVPATDTPKILITTDTKLDELDDILSVLNQSEQEKGRQ